MKRIGNTLVWTVIAAAFIGPGTVTAAASAGASFGTALLWAIVFSVLATFVLQEAAGRLTIATGQDLGQYLRQRYPTGTARWISVALVGGAILLGSAAYEAGNILGGVAGAMLALDAPRWTMTLAVGALAGVLLAIGSPRAIAQSLAGLVALMGLGFLVVAAMVAPPLGEIATGLLLPSIPTGGALVVVALIGTTVVPYNLFLGSGLAHGQQLSDMRRGLLLAVVLGGLITLGILVTGSALEGEFSFEALAQLLEQRLGAWAATGFALGLFAAGLTSAVTAPLAAALTARGLFASDECSVWEDRGWRFRSVWLAVLLVGIGFGLAEVRPVPAIILAQALNGILLPVIALFLFAAVRDRHVMGEAVNTTGRNAAMIVVLGIAIMLGVVALWRVAQALLG